MSRFSIPYLYNPGVLVGRISHHLNEKIKKTIKSETSKTNPRNERLVSIIQNTYETPYIPELWKYIDDMFYVWKREFCVNFIKHEISSVWTNYMRKNEFNPMHSHSSSVSFVLWVQIPFKAEDEEKYSKFNNPTEKCSTGAFEFLYPTMTGELMSHKIQNDVSDEGTVIMFPAKMKHCVYPFYTSDEERISIAGNITVEQEI